MFVALSVMCYLDRSALSFASLHLSRDLQFGPGVYGLGAGLFYAGYSAFMVPSQLFMMRVGPRAWLAGLAIAWGALATCFSGLRTPRQFYALRFLLGAAESGAFPAMWYVIYQFWPLSDIVVPLAVLEASVGVANTLAAPLAAGLLSLDGIAGMRGWQWLFAAEGLPTIALGLLTLHWLPTSPAAAGFLSRAEKEWLVCRVDTSRKQAAPSSPAAAPAMVADALGNRAVVWAVATCPKVWWVTAMGGMKNVAASAMLFWLPSLIHSLLGGTVQTPTATVEVAGAAAATLSHQDALMALHAVLLSGIPFVAGSVFTLCIAHNAQRRGDLAMHLAVPYGLAAVGFAVLPGSMVRPVLAFGLLVIIVSCVQGCNSIINAYIPLVAPSSAAVPVAMAAYNSVANLGGLVGPWLVGAVMQHTRSYTLAMHGMAALMAGAALMAASTRTWKQVAARDMSGGGAPLHHAKSDGANGQYQHSKDKTAAAEAGGGAKGGGGGRGGAYGGAWAVVVQGGATMTAASLKHDGSGATPALHPRHRATSFCGKPNALSATADDLNA